MTKYQEIIRLTALEFSQRTIMASCGVVQKTVAKVQKRARELKLLLSLYLYKSLLSRLTRRLNCSSFFK